MLYVMGGSSRSGKTIIGRRFVKEKAIPFFCIDFLVTSLQEIKLLNVRHGQPSIDKAEKLWPLVRPLLVHLLEDEPNYLIEGDGILPKHIVELMKQYPNKIRACFMGFSEVDLNQKLRNTRKFTDKSDWTKKVDDMELRKNIKNMIEFSKYLKAECQKYSIQYFDSSKNFGGCLEKTFQYLTEFML